MGRTIPTANQAILNELEEFRGFRRVLFVQEQHAFDQLMGYAQQHSAAISMANHALPFEAALLAMLVEMQKEVARLRTLCEQQGIDDEDGDGLVVRRLCQ